ncbi:hypothetical protein [Aeromonas sp. R6-2]|uniref:Dph6-related ATP pyrophosphatase n=1 Tax=unclassified Aeromonas TaxID=257493 RepID=UPI0034A4FA66
MSRAIMLWTGGKDSMLALTEARLQGVAVAALVTFTPPSPHFLAHPLPLIHAQADALALPLYRMTITAPYATSYERTLAELRERLGIDCVITGDIAPVGAPNWIVERCHSLGLSPLLPLWERPRKALLERLLSLRIECLFSCVNTRNLPANWVGRRLDAQALLDLEQLAARGKLDLCGEQGEYHTMTLNGPGFRLPLRVEPGTIARQGELAYLHAPRLILPAA